MAFRYFDHLGGSSTPATVTVLISGSDVIQVGDAVSCIAAASADGAGIIPLVASSSKSVFGVVVDIVDVNGNSVWGSTAVLGSATITGTPTSGSVTVASTNPTVDKIAAKVIVSKEARFSADVTGTVNTTVFSATLGAYLNCDDENSLDETTATRTAGTARQFYSWGNIDKDDTTRLVVSINSSEVYNNVDVLAA